MFRKFFLFKLLINALLVSGLIYLITFSTNQDEANVLEKGGIFMNPNAINQSEKKLILKYINKFLNGYSSAKGRKQHTSNKTAGKFPSTIEPKHESIILRLCEEDQKTSNYPLEECVKDLVKIVYKTQAQPKILVHWTLLSGHERLGIRNGHHNFGGCPVDNCLFVPNRPIFVKNSDVLIWNPKNSDTTFKLPPGLDKKKFTPTGNRTRGAGGKAQLWVFILREPPLNMKMPGDGLSGMNIIMTYKRNSDIQLSWANVESRFKVEDMDGSKEKGVLGSYKAETDWDRLEKKARSPGGKVAWFVSNCQTHSRREYLVQELATYLPVDVYGECGDKTCSKDSKESCFQLLQDSYKFYLSFENSLCLDYVTEKLYNAMSLDILPVVYGIGHYTNPPGFDRKSGVKAFVDVLDYGSVRDLADYLLWVDKTPSAYLSYFEWKRSYRLVKYNFWCQLCAKLNDPLTYQEPLLTYGPLREWFGSDDCVLLKSSFFGRGANDTSDGSFIDLSLISRAAKELVKDQTT